VDSAFADVAQLAAGCRFSDCAHETEPGCAVQEALGSGTLDAARWASYLKLERELRRVSLRRGSREHRELKRRWRARARETRRERRYGGKP
jgi:ribosome biogenesis GTPase